MARKSLGTLTLDLIAKVSGFEQGMDKASRKSSKTTKQIERHANQIAKSIGVATTAAAAGIAAMVADTTRTAREVRNLAQTADASPQSFQKMTYAAKRFGIEQEKMADILKDTNDRIGDFIQTGGGPMADFFEQIAPKVGVTADEFARLSGPEALQLYVKSLEDAGVSQKDMTFYMEAIASDATALLPLLADNGKELRRLGDEAERTGNVFSDMEFQQLEDAQKGIDELAGAFTGMKNEIAIGALPAVNELVDLLSDDQTTENAKTLGSAIATSMVTAASAISDVIDLAKWLGEEIASEINGAAFGDLPRMAEEIEEQEKRLQLMRLSNARNGVGDDAPIRKAEARLERLKDLYQQAIELQQQASEGTGDPGAGGGSAGGDAGDGETGSGGGTGLDGPDKIASDMESRREAIIESLQTEKEAILSAFGERDAEITELRNEGAISEMEADDLRFRNKREMEEALTDLTEDEVEKRRRLEEQSQKAVRSYHASTWQLASQFLNTFAEDSKAAALASIAINKGLAMAQTIQNTEAAKMAAMVIDPSGAMAARVAFMGKVSLGIIAATGLMEGYNVLSGGGSVGTGGYSSSGDHPPTSSPANEDIAMQAPEQDDRRGVQIIFNGPVNGLDSDQIARSIKDHLDNTDFVLIEPASRNGRALKG